MRIYSTTGAGRAAAEAALRAIEGRAASQDPAILRQVRAIVKSVRRQGDVAVRRYAARFDKLSVETPLLVSEREMEAAWQQITREQQAALKLAASRIRTYAKRQVPKQWSLRDSTGVQLGQIVRPLEGIACYVPAGRHPLPSTLLMTAIPAQVAGVPRIVVLCPRPTPIVLAAAYLLGTMNVYRIGGAQAIAAAAYGTQSVPRVDKIAGPGSAFVTVAKQIIAADPSNTCSIDMAAGPTETLIASNTGDAEAIAADLFAQAEHDAATLPIFVTTNADLAKQVREEAKNQSAGNAVARQSLRENGAIFVVASQQEMADVVNRIAPEHLTVDSETDLDWVRNAGSVFVGTQTPQALGDYISGPNHTLPTAGFARQRGGLSVADFVKTISVQSASSTALRKLAPAAIELAQAEGLAAHAASLRLALAKAEQRGRA